jgi:hypothetical protein
LCFSICAIIFVFIFASAYFLYKILKQKPNEKEFKENKDKLNQLYILNYCQSECIHNICHYFRNMDAQLQQFLSNKEKYSEEDLTDIVNRFDYFLIILTSNLQNYFSFVSDDNCSVSIKVIDKNKEFIRTYFRDPVNLNKRKKSDRNYKSSKYKISENTAFDVILDPKFDNVHFYDDNLSELYDKHLYRNSNENWHKLYNSTLVVPISIVLKENDRDILGFITIDNKKGNLSTDVNKEFLFGIGDMLYNMFNKFSEFSTFALNKIPENDRIKTFRLGN